MKKSIKAANYALKSSGLAAYKYKHTVEVVFEVGLPRQSNVMPRLIIST